MLPGTCSGTENVLQLAEPIAAAARSWTAKILESLVR
jgi:hypothetical protein